MMLIATRSHAPARLGRLSCHRAGPLFPLHCAAMTAPAAPAPKVRRSSKPMRILVTVYTILLILSTWIITVVGQ